MWHWNFLLDLRKIEQLLALSVTGRSYGGGLLRSEQDIALTLFGMKRDAARGCDGDRTRSSAIRRSATYGMVLLHRIGPNAALNWPRGGWNVFPVEGGST